MWLKTGTSTTPKQQNRTFSLSLYCALPASFLTWKNISTHYGRVLKHKERRDWIKKKKKESKVWRTETTYGQNMFIRVFYHWDTCIELWNMNNLMFIELVISIYGKFLNSLCIFLCMSSYLITFSLLFFFFYDVVIYYR